MLYLYHGTTSVCAIKVRLTIAEKALPWDGEVLWLQRGDQYQPDYLKLNPNAVVPTLVHDGKVIIKSTVIMEYLDETFPEIPLIPPTPTRGRRYASGSSASTSCTFTAGQSPPRWRSAVISCVKLRMAATRMSPAHSTRSSASDYSVLWMMVSRHARQRMQRATARHGSLTVLADLGDNLAV